MRRSGVVLLVALGGLAHSAIAWLPVAALTSPGGPLDPTTVARRATDRIVSRRHFRDRLRATHAGAGRCRRYFDAPSVFENRDADPNALAFVAAARAAGFGDREQAVARLFGAWSEEDEQRHHAPMADEYEAVLEADADFFERPFLWVTRDKRRYELQQTEADSSAFTDEERQTLRSLWVRYWLGAHIYRWRKIVA